MGHIANGFWMPSVRLRVGVPGVELAALLLDSFGRVRGDADMVFHGQPEHPSGAVRHGFSGLELDLNVVEAAVERIVVAGSAEGGVLEAVAPDGSTVVSYTVTDAGGVSAVAFGEFFRESGGWKFGALGQGYGSGLASLVQAYGVEVAEDEPAAAASGPVPLTGVVKVPGQAPPVDGEPVLGGPFPPPDREYRLVEGWEFGPVFEPFTAEGEGDQVITVDTHVPGGPVLVEVAHEGEGYVSLYPLDARNKDGDFIFASPLPDFRGSRTTMAPGNRPLRFRITATNRWILRVKPLAAARRMQGTLRGYGPEVLLHTGGTADLRVDFKGGPDRDDGYVSLYSHEVAGRTKFKGSGDLLLSKSGAMRQTVPLPEGPVVLEYYAAGAWALGVKELGH
ncbi:TerD family protein [Streptomyces sp. NPDC046712]|uniref:TerD family protein n=1 Tax=Streptomyces sp. NPDC046712 TaxID=3154802 RepID=UPI0033D1F343